jgi:2-oxoisovalerate dehydrogenase E2 component (dihydrolipoyl transacylase)
MSNTRTFAVPDLGEGLDAVTIVHWLVEPGDHVALNQTLCVVETAKAEVDIPSPHDGVVQAFGGADGDTLAVGAMLATFELINDVFSVSQVEHSPIHATVATPTPVESPAPVASGDAQVGSPAGAQTLVGYGPDPQLDRSRRVLASPAVRKAALDAGVAIGHLSPGSGPDGVIMRRDIEAATAPPVDRSTVRHAPTGNGITGATPLEATYETVEVTGVRARIAEHMTLSRRTIADASCTVEVDATRLLETRDLLNQFSDTDTHLTSFALLCRIVVAALQDSPMLNTSFDNDANEIHVHHNIHLGIGTATPRGLVVAVVRDAQPRTLTSLANELRRVTTSAKSATLAPADMVGSTFTISNFGSLGLDSAVPIINAPQAAILGIGSIKLRPWVVDGTVVARSTLSLTLVFDHRVCDGTEAGRFMTDLRALIEQPERLLLAS